MTDIENVKKTYEDWVNNIFDSQLTKKLVAMDETEILDSFSGDLEFGTAGMRGVMGIGSNRMNEVTVTRLAAAVTKYLEKEQSPSIVIGFDTRNNSKKFSRIFARYATNNGIRVYLFKNFCPTPILSYAIGYTKATMGIMITASHNNKIYNGIKISNSDGIQVSGESQQALTDLYNQTDGISVYNRTYNLSIKKELLTVIKKEVEKDFLSYGKEPEKTDRKLKIVYTPLNGTGYRAVKKLLKKNGFKLYVPKKQKKGNGEFLTCPYPNPEFEDAFCEAKKLAKKVDADIIVATDPDADRIGVMTKTQNGFYKLSGNEVGYIFLSEKCKNCTDPNAFAVTSVVTSPLSKSIAEKYNVQLSLTLTGFKNLGKAMFENIHKYGENAYTLAYEESCGYILRNDLFDKDGIFASLEICKITDELKQSGKTLYDRLQEIYASFGYLANINASIVFEGNDAKEKMQQSVDKFRNQKPKTLGEENVKKVVDYLNDDTGLEKQNFLRFETDNIVAIVRPSGTEPKLKFYIFAKADSMQTAEQIASGVYTEIKEFCR